MTVRSFVTFASFVSLLSCGGSPTTPNGNETITGTERFGWDQPAADAGELGTFRYAMYLDGVRGEAADVSCDPSPASGRFGCTCRLPSMSGGAHALQVATFVLDAGLVRESARSAPVQVFKR